MPLIEHLATWGEVSVCEARGFIGAAQWLEALESAGLVEEIRGDGGVTTWSVSRKGEALLDAKLDTVARLALFQVPAYRAYLVGILAEGLALAGKADIREQLEAWTGEELNPLLREINEALDCVEASFGRLIDASKNEIERRCRTLPGRSNDYGGWDQILLGRAGRPQDLFDFALRKFAPLATLPPATRGNGPAGVLRPLPVTSDDGEFESALKPGGWNIRRHRVHSSIALFDHDGVYLHGPDQRAGVGLRSALQDALVSHPFYKAIVNLAICAWRSPATTIPAVALKLSSRAELGDVRLFIGPRDTGLLRQRLCDLVAQQGVRVRGLANGVIPGEVMDAVLRGLIEHQILRRVEDEIQLHPDYQATLMAGRLRTVFRPGKELQTRMLEWLASQERSGARREVSR